MSVAAPSSPAFIRNKRPGPTVHTHGDITIKWQGANDPAGEDVQQVPPEVLQSATFRRAMARGIFQQISEAEADAAFSRSMGAAMAIEAAQVEELSSIIDSSETDNVLVPATCLISGQPITIQQAYVGIIPPLAPEYMDRAAEFTPQVNAQGVIEWKHIATPNPGA